MSIYLLDTTLAIWPYHRRKKATMTTAAIADILGGRKVLGRTVTRSAELAALVRRFVPISTRGRAMFPPRSASRSERSRADLAAMSA